MTVYELNTGLKVLVHVLVSVPGLSFVMDGNQLSA